MKYKIVLVPFPFDDFSSTKVRPALCLTNEIGRFQHLVIAFISSQIPAQFDKTDLILPKQNTGLAVDSVIKLHRLVTIPKAMIQRKLGKLPESYELQIKQILNNLFEL